MTGFWKYNATRYEAESGPRVRVKETHQKHTFNQGYIPQRSYQLLNKPETQAIEIWEEIGAAIGIDRSDMLDLLSDRDVDNGICSCDDPEVGRTLAKGTAAEKPFCAECGGLINDAEQRGDGS